jgi:hypothetical protein
MRVAALEVAACPDVAARPGAALHLGVTTPVVTT